MPSDLQLIDGFERLRSEFIEANPSASLKAPETKSANGRPALDEALEAWLKTVLGFDGTSGQERRWMRALVKVMTDEQASIAAAEAAEPGLGALLRRHRGLVERGKKAAARLAELETGGRIALKGSPANHAAEAEAWGAALPGLAGLKKWRMLENLGRPVVVPDQPVQRFFYRLGLIEEANGASAAFAQAAACIEKSLQLTGMPAGEIARLLQWHTRHLPNFFGGHRCGADPDCAGCPFGAGCMHFRFAGTSNAANKSDERAREEAERLKSAWDERDPREMEEGELLATLLQGAKSERPLRLAEDLLRRFGDLRGVDLASVEELAQFKGIGPARARMIKSALELGRKLTLNPLKRGTTITQSEEVWSRFRERFRNIPQEHFIVLLLDTKNRVIQTHIVSKGSLNSSPAHPREVFKQAIKQSASGVILMHNHPSGEPDPSPEDRAITDQLVESGRILGIRVLDHIILGSDSYYSFRDNGEI
jgi:DNA repair protein RadC